MCYQCLRRLPLLHEASHRVLLNIADSSKAWEQRRMEPLLPIVQAEMQEVRTLLEELRREAEALSLLAHLRHQAGLTDAQLQVVQRRLGQETTDGAGTSSGPVQRAALSGALTDLAMTGCEAAKLLGVAHAVLHAAKSTAADTGQEGAAQREQSSELVKQAVLGAVELSLALLKQAASDTDALAAMEGAIGCLDAAVGPDASGVGGDAAEWLQGLRQEVWQALLGFVLDAEQADSAALPPVLALVGAIAPDAAGSSR